MLDCGEDKNDGHPEYGGTVCFHNFRLAETKFLEKVAESGEHNADGIEYKLIICHNPFTYRHENEIFAIEPTVLQDRRKGSAIIEDDILLTEDGCVLISKRQPAIIEIPYRTCEG